MADATLSVDLALAGGAALVGGTLARALRQSVLTGYLAGGILISPFTPGPVGNTAIIERMADIGVALLMFGVGVHFSLRELARARLLSLGAVAQVPLSLAVAGGVTYLAGWSGKEALFFGGVAAVSSSIVLVKLLDERGEEHDEHGRLAIAWSLVQDLATVALIVALGAAAGDGDDLFRALVIAALKAAAFIGGMLLVGTRLLPWLLAQVQRLDSRELFILAVAVLAVGTAVLSEQLGLSLALGAFIAGVVVNDSDLSHLALAEVLPVRDLFAALFFVSVGMLIDPALLWERLPLFLLLVVLVLSKGPLTALLCGLLTRCPPRTAALVGIGLAPSAEFSFLLARLGVDAGAVSSDAFSLMLAATAATLVVAPLLYRLVPAREPCHASTTSHLAQTEFVD